MARDDANTRVTGHPNRQTRVDAVYGMKTAHNDGVSRQYETAGRGPTVAFCGDIGLGPWQFGWQYAAVAGPFCAVVPEPRGAGGSDAPAGEWSVEAFAADLEAILHHHGADRAHLVGYGFGGMVALEYARTYSRARSLTLVGAAASGDGYDAAAVWAPPGDSTAITASLESTFGADFREDHAEELERISDWRADEDASQAEFEAQQAALGEFDISDRLYEITVPSLVIQGSRDQVTPRDSGSRLAEGLPRGGLVTTDTGHFAGIEASAAVNDELRGWLDEHRTD